MIDLFGSLPGCVDFRAALLASHGFLAYALPNYGYRDMPRSFAQAARPDPAPTRPRPSPDLPPTRPRPPACSACPSACPPK